MTIFQVTCITKIVHNDPRHRITHLGGPNWYDTQLSVIRAIRNKTAAFYVNPPNADKVWLVVRTSPYGHEYVKTTADGEHPNNLLSLQECRRS